MSDVTVAPAGGAPSAAPTNEVVVNENQTSVPNPVGSQAPDKPVGDIEGGKGRPESRREAIQRAFERASNPPPKDAKPAEKPAPKAADAKPGHNRPPEETPKLDLKKRPADQPPPQHREQGRFARAPDAPTTPGAPAQQAQQKPVPQLPEGAPYRDPPQRMAEHAKREWAAAPESVRGEIHRMQNEFAKAYQFYKNDYEAFKPIRHFHEMARSHGTTLEAALTNFVSMEQKLRADPIGGLEVIVHNLGLKTNEGQPATLRDVAYTVLSQTPEQLRLTQQGNNQQAAVKQIGALHQEVVGLKQTLQQMHTQQQLLQTRSAVDQFADAHPRFDELGTLIDQELKLGFDLETAYRRAELLRPTQAAQTRTPTPPAQTRTADKSISGSPGVAPSNGASRRPEKQVGRREAIQSAIRRHAGGL